MNRIPFARHAIAMTTSCVNRPSRTRHTGGSRISHTTGSRHSRNASTASSASSSYPGRYGNDAIPLQRALKTGKSAHSKTSARSAAMPSGPFKSRPPLANPTTH